MNLHLFTTTYEDRVRHTEEKTIPFVDDGGREVQLINLYPQVRYQRWEGFGGAITESAACVYAAMNAEQKKHLLQAYFGELNYRFVRIPIDSCDFSLGNYDADGDKNDEAFTQFSFDRMEQYILPMLRDAEAICGRKLEIMLSPWSPPAYMKSNHDRNHGGKLLPQYRRRWAEYICRYIEEFRRRGFCVTMLTLQNEPKAVQKWDSCIYTAEEEKSFLREHMYPTLREHGLDDIEIYIWDHNKERALEWAETIFDDETGKMAIGLAFHWYSGDHFEALQMIRERFPDKKLLLSEACIEFSKYRAAPPATNAQRYAHDIIGDMNAGMQTFLDWNLLLDENGGPNHTENYCDAPFFYHMAEHSLEERALYAYLRHFGHFIKPGDVRIGASRYTQAIEAVAFENEGSITAVLLNQTEEPQTAYLRIAEQCAHLTLSPKSISTAVIRTE